MNGSFKQRRGESGSVEGPPNLGGAASATLISCRRSSQHNLQRLIGNGRCNVFASSHGARIQRLRSSSVMRITGIAYGWIGSTMAFGAVEGRSQTDVRERLSAAPRSENIAVLRSAARSRRTTAGAAAGEAGKPKVETSRPGWLGGWLT